MKPSFYIGAAFLALMVWPGEAKAWASGSVDERAVGRDKLKSDVADCRGIYIIFLNRSPYYVGMSNSSIRDRLIAHFSGRGSSRIAGQLDRGNDLSYEWMCLDNPEQAEAQLIKELGTSTEGNLRREIDPADRYPDIPDPK